MVLEAFCQTRVLIIIHAGLDDLRSFGQDRTIAPGAGTNDGDMSMLFWIALLEGGHHYPALVSQALRLHRALNRGPSSLLACLGLEPVILPIGQVGRRV